MPARTDTKAPAAPYVPQLSPQGKFRGKPSMGLTRPLTLIGSRNRAHLHLVSDSISKCHAAVINTGRGVYVRDLSSRTHTFVNGGEVREGELSHGDQITVGAFTFRFEDEANTEHLARPAPPAELQTRGRQSYRMQGRSTTIGRRSGCDVCIPDAAVSNVHAIIFETDGARIIRDLGSRTGTHVNGVAVHQQELNPGDRIKIGPVEYSYTPVESIEHQDDLDELEDLVGTAPLAEDADLIPVPAPAPKAVPVPAPPMPKPPVLKSPVLKSPGAPAKAPAAPTPVETDLDLIPLAADDIAPAKPAPVAKPAPAAKPAARVAPPPVVAREPVQEIDLEADLDSASAADTVRMPAPVQTPKPPPSLSKLISEEPAAAPVTPAVPQPPKVVARPAPLAAPVIPVPPIPAAPFAPAVSLTPPIEPEPIEATADELDLGQPETAAVDAFTPIEPPPSEDLALDELQLEPPTAEENLATAPAEVSAEDVTVEELASEPISPDTADETRPIESVSDAIAIDGLELEPSGIEAAEPTQPTAEAVPADAFELEPPETVAPVVADLAGTVSGTLPAETLELSVPVTADAPQDLDLPHLLHGTSGNPIDFNDLDDLLFDEPVTASSAGPLEITGIESPAAPIPPSEVDGLPAELQSGINGTEPADLDRDFFAELAADEPDPLTPAAPPTAEAATPAETSDGAAGLVDLPDDFLLDDLDVAPDAAPAPTEASLETALPIEPMAAPASESPIDVQETTSAPDTWADEPAAALSPVDQADPITIQPTAEVVSDAFAAPSAEWDHAAAAAEPGVESAEFSSTEVVPAPGPIEAPHAPALADEPSGQPFDGSSAVIGAEADAPHGIDLTTGPLAETPAPLEVSATHFAAPDEPPAPVLAESAEHPAIESTVDFPAEPPAIEPGPVVDPLGAEAAPSMNDGIVPSSIQDSLSPSADLIVDPGTSSGELAESQPAFEPTPTDPAATQSSASADEANAQSGGEPAVVVATASHDWQPQVEPAPAEPEVAADFAMAHEPPADLEFELPELPEVIPTENPPAEQTPVDLRAAPTQSEGVLQDAPAEASAQEWIESSLADDLLAESALPPVESLPASDEQSAVINLPVETVTELPAVLDEPAVVETVAVVQPAAQDFAPVELDQPAIEPASDVQPTTPEPVSIVAPQWMPPEAVDLPPNVEVPWIDHVGEVELPPILPQTHEPDAAASVWPMASAAGSVTASGLDAPPVLSGIDSLADGLSSDASSAAAPAVEFTSTDVSETSVIEAPLPQAEMDADTVAVPEPDGLVPLPEVPAFVDSSVAEPTPETVPAGEDVVAMPAADSTEPAPLELTANVESAGVESADIDPVITESDLVVVDDVEETFDPPLAVTEADVAEAPAIEPAPAFNSSVKAPPIQPEPFLTMSGPASQPAPVPPPAEIAPPAPAPAPQAPAMRQFDPFFGMMRDMDSFIGGLPLSLPTPPPPPPRAPRLPFGQVKVTFDRPASPLAGFDDGPVSPVIDDEVVPPAADVASGTLRQSAVFDPNAVQPPVPATPTTPFSGARLADRPAESPDRFAGLAAAFGAGAVGLSKTAAVAVPLSDILDIPVGQPAARLAEAEQPKPAPAMPPVQPAPPAVPAAPPVVQAPLPQQAAPVAIATAVAPVPEKKRQPQDENDTPIVVGEFDLVDDLIPEADAEADEPELLDESLLADEPGSDVLAELLPSPTVEHLEPAASTTASDDVEVLDEWAVVEEPETSAVPPALPPALPDPVAAAPAVLEPAAETSVAPVPPPLPTPDDAVVADESLLVEEELNLDHIAPATVPDTHSEVEDAPAANDKVRPVLESDHDQSATAEAAEPTESSWEDDLIFEEHEPIAVEEPDLFDGEAIEPPPPPGAIVAQTPAAAPQPVTNEDDLFFDELIQDELDAPQTVAPADHSDEDPLVGFEPMGVPIDPSPIQAAAPIVIPPVKPALTPPRPTLPPPARRSPPQAPQQPAAQDIFSGAVSTGGDPFGGTNRNIDSIPELALDEQIPPTAPAPDGATPNSLAKAAKNVPPAFGQSASLPPGAVHPRRKQRGFLLFLVLTAAAGSGAYAWTHYHPPGTVTGSIRFRGVEHLSELERAEFYRKEVDLLADPQTRARAAAGLPKGVNAGFLGSDSDKVAQFDAAIRAASWNGKGDLSLQASSTATDADRVRMRRLLEVLYDRNQTNSEEVVALRASLGQARKQAAIADANLTAEQRRATEARELAGRQVTIQLEADDLKHKVEGLLKELELADQAVHTQVRALEQAEATTAGPATRPTLAADDPELKQLEADLAALTAQLTQAKQTRDKQAVEAKTAFDAAQGKFEQQLNKARASVGDDTAMAKYVASHLAMRDIIRKMNDEFVQQQKEDREFVDGQKTRMLTLNADRLKQLWSEDDELKKLNQLASMTEHRYNTARAARLPEATTLATQTTEFKRQAEARRQLLADKDLYTPQIKQMQDFIDEFLRRMEQARVRNDARLQDLFKQAAAASPEVDKLPVEQRKMAREMDEAREALSTARSQFATTLEQVNRQSEDRVKLLTSQVAAQTAKVEDRRKQAVAAAAPADTATAQAREEQIRRRREEVNRSRQAYAVAQTLYQDAYRRYQAKVAENTAAAAAAATVQNAGQELARLQQTKADADAEFAKLNAQLDRVIEPEKPDEESVRVDTGKDIRGFLLAGIAGAALVLTFLSLFLTRGRPVSPEFTFAGTGDESRRRLGSRGRDNTADGAVHADTPGDAVAV